MKIKPFFILTFVFFAFFLLVFAKGKKGYSAPTTLTSWEQEVREIDEQIAELKEMKKGYVAKATKHETQAERLQFLQQELQTAKKHWLLAEENREIAKKIQKNIDQLEEKKRTLLKKRKDTNECPPQEKPSIQNP